MARKTLHRKDRKIRTRKIRTRKQRGGGDEEVTVVIDRPTSSAPIDGLWNKRFKDTEFMKTLRKDLGVQSEDVEFLGKYKGTLMVTFVCNSLKNVSGQFKSDGSIAKQVGDAMVKYINENLSPQYVAKLTRSSHRNVGKRSRISAGIYHNHKYDNAAPKIIKRGENSTIMKDDDSSDEEM